MDLSRGPSSLSGLFHSFPAQLLREVRPDGPSEHILGRFAFGWWPAVPVAFLTWRLG
jgi:hypothetical protein